MEPDTRRWRWAAQAPPQRRKRRPARHPPHPRGAIPTFRASGRTPTSTPFERPDKPAAPPVPRRQDSTGTHDPNVASVGVYNDFWTERGPRESSAAERDRGGQTSLIVDLADGKLPPMTPAARSYADALETIRRPEQPGIWSELNPYDRCITRRPAWRDDARVLQPQLFDSAGAGIRGDFGRDDSRRPHHPARRTPASGLGPRQWMGHSRGRWEGDTLVVETTDFNDKIDEVTGNAMRLPDGQPLGQVSRRLRHRRHDAHRTLYARRCQYDRLPVHHDGPARS